MRVTAGVIGLVAIATSLSSGCSVLVVRGPAPSTKPRVDVSCTEERWAPALDVVNAISYAVGAAYGVPVYEHWPSAEVVAIEAVAIVATLSYTASAVYGYETTERCAEAKDEAYRFHARQLKEQLWQLQENGDTLADPKAKDDEPSNKTVPPVPPSDPDRDLPAAPSAPGGEPTQPPG